jgi:Mn-dependent DtxR family transcriptional regulator
MDKTPNDRILELLATRCNQAGAEPEGFGMVGTEVAEGLQMSWQEAVIAFDELLDKGLVEYNPGDGIVRLKRKGYEAAGGK